MKYKYDNMNVKISVVAVLHGTFLNRQMFEGGTKKWSQIYVIWKCKSKKHCKAMEKAFA